MGTETGTQVLDPTARSSPGSQSRKNHLLMARRCIQSTMGMGLRVRGLMVGWEAVLGKDLQNRLMEVLEKVLLSHLMGAFEKVLLSHLTEVLEKVLQNRLME